MIPTAWMAHAIQSAMDSATMTMICTSRMSDACAGRYERTMRRIMRRFIAHICHLRRCPRTAELHSP